MPALDGSGDTGGDRLGDIWHTYRGTRAYARAGGSAPSGRAFWPHEQQARGRHARRPRSFGVTTPGADARDIFGTLAKERKKAKREPKGRDSLILFVFFSALHQKEGEYALSLPRRQTWDPALTSDCRCCLSLLHVVCCLLCPCLFSWHRGVLGGATGRMWP